LIDTIRRLSDMFPDEDFLFEMSDWIHDFEILSVENGATYGICYPESRKTRTYLAKHESVEDICRTSQHEPLHSILVDYQFMSEEPFDMDIEEEHKVIQKISWIANEQVFDVGYFSLYKGQEIKPKIREEEYKTLMRKYNRQSDNLEDCNE